MQNFRDQVHVSCAIAMKRTADQASLPMSPQRMRVTVIVPPDNVTGDQTMNFHLDCDSSFTIDMVKRALIHQMYLVSGRAPKSSSFQLRQEDDMFRRPSPLRV